MANLFEQLFGWNLKPKIQEKEPETFAPEITDDGALVVASGGVWGTYLDMEGSARSEAELVARYRDMSQHPEVDSAIDDVVDEAIVMDEDFVVRIITDNVKDVSDSVKNKIEDEFETILELLDFSQTAYQYFKQWYIDGRLYFNVIIDEKKPQEGIKELRYVDPRKIRKVREIESVPKNGYTLKKTKAEYYVYNERGFTGKDAQPSSYAPDTASMAGLKITLDSIIHTTSGLLDTNNQLVYSFLHKAMKPLNQLRTLEDAVVIYRVSRAPERRVFSVDVGNLPKVKADQYLRDIMVKHKNRLVYDAATGEVRDDRKFLTMMEDYWFARRDGGRGTDVTTLPAGQNLGELTDVEYFQRKLYKSLGVPVSRLEPEMGMTLGRASEISRDEVKFSKFIGRIRRRFNQLFLKALEKQLILKKIILPEEWAAIGRQLKFDYIEDNHFTELKNLEIMANRMQVLGLMEPYIGRAYSWLDVRKNVLKQTEEEIARIDEEIAAEMEMEQYMAPELKMALQQQELGLLPEPGEDGEEDDPNIGEPTKGPPEKSPEQESNIGSPTKPPFGKKNGVDTPEGQKSKPKPKPKKN